MCMLVSGCCICHLSQASAGPVSRFTCSRPSSQRSTGFPMCRPISRLVSKVWPAGEVVATTMTSMPFPDIKDMLDAGGCVTGKGLGPACDLLQQAWPAMTFKRSREPGHAETG